MSGACMRAGFEPRIAFETDDYTAVQGFVAAGVGVSIIAELGLRLRARRHRGAAAGPRDPGPPDLREHRQGLPLAGHVGMLDMLREVGAAHATSRPVLELVSYAERGGAPRPARELRRSHRRRYGSRRFQ